MSSVLTYIKNRTPLDPTCYQSIDRFWVHLRWQFTERLRAQLFELQPGDRTRYRFAIAQIDAEHVVVTMLVPTMHAIEVDPRECRPGPYDLYIEDPYTAGIFADVLSAVVWGDNDRYYDYERSEPRWMNRTAPGTTEENT